MVSDPRQLHPALHLPFLTTARAAVALHCPLAPLRLLANLQLDITSFSCNQHLQTSLGSNELQQLFQMSGVVRAFSPIDRSALEERLVAFEQQTGCRIGIEETDADPSFSAFRSTSIPRPSKASKLRTAVTGKP